MRSFIAIICVFLVCGNALASPKTKFEEALKKAEGGDAEAQFAVALMYERGQGVDQDFHEALKWYGKSADQGDPAAQSTLGWFYQYGKGVKKDPETALSWNRKAAERGDPYGQLNLAVMLDEGVDVPENNEEAIFWYRKAAAQGLARVQLNLGVMYWEGEGVEQNTQEAWNLLNNARFTSEEKEIQWKARRVLDKIKHRLGVDRPNGVGRFSYPEWDVIEKHIKKSP